MYKRLAAVAATTLVLLGCGDDGDSRTPAVAGERVRVSAAFYPLQFLAEQVGGDRVTVTSLTEPGAEPHDVELTAKQVAGLSTADLVIFQRGFQPAVDDAVEQQAAERALDLTTVEPLEDGFVPLEEGELREDEQGKDPHVWLDPQRMQGLVGAIAARLAELQPDAATAVAANATDLKSRLAALDDEFRKGLATCERKDLVTSHNAFGYLARRYGLEQVALTGLTPEAEPSPKRLIEVATFARDRKVTTIFFEELVSPKIAESLAREVGATAKVLHPLESPPESGDYFAAMRENLATLRTALGCR